VPRRLGLAALVAAPILCSIGIAAAAASAKPTITISGRAYAFNHMSTGLSGATIRVRELPGVSAVTDASGDYVLEVPDDANVTPYIDPPPGYHQIDLQTFHTRGRPIVNVNFQTPADAEYYGLAALLSVPLGPDGRPEQCVIVTTASARNVRGVDFATFQARTPHGVAGATARTIPGLGPPIYFNDSVIPDPSRSFTSGDGGIIWTGVAMGAYRVITESATTRFASFLATCAPGRIVNANPPWGAYELSGHEQPLASGVVAGSVVRLGSGHKGGRRLVNIAVRTAEPLKAKVRLRQAGKPIARKRTTTFRAPFGKLPLRVSQAAKRGPATLSVKFTDPAGDSVTDRFRPHLPAQ
jgi:hypothetical protein